jgi:tRNA threonylcarbamoyl adenosine modification protein YeaZ
LYLAVDTSTDTAGLALVREGLLIAEMNWRAERNHVRQLMPNLEHMLRQLEVTTGSIAAVIVARGPGSFNGLRVGVSAAKALAFSLDVPIVGVSSLEAEAFQYALTGRPVCPVFNAGRGEIATALYRMEGDTWRQLSEERLTTVDALCAEVPAETLFCGEHVAVVAGRLRELLGEKALMASPVSGIRRAAYLAELGIRRLEAGDFDDAATLQPVYVRGPSITKAKHR